MCVHTYIIHPLHEDIEDTVYMVLLKILCTWFNLYSAVILIWHIGKVFNFAKLYLYGLYCKNGFFQHSTQNHQFKILPIALGTNH